MALAELRAAGLRVVMSTGDDRVTAAAVARRLDIGEVGDRQEFRVWAGGLNIVRPSLW